MEKIGRIHTDCAAWTDSGFLFTCDDLHSTISVAISCIRYAGGYVIAVEKSVMRALTAEEEAQFQALAHSAVSPAPRPNASSANVPARTVGETMVEFVLRVMSAYRFVCEECEAGYGSWRNTGKQDNATAIRESDEEQPKAA